jgi:hypothetical protein
MAAPTYAPHRIPLRRDFEAGPPLASLERRHSNDACRRDKLVNASNEVPVVSHDTGLVGVPGAGIRDG